jgi:hypothetical protein
MQSLGRLGGAALVAALLGVPLGCASTSQQSGSATAGSPGEIADAPIKMKHLSKGRQASASPAKGPTLDRQGCDPTGKASVVVQKGPTGEPNAWKYFAVVKRGAATKKVLKCEAVDNNADGYVDARFFYDDNGQLLLEQRDLDFDGHAEVVADYSHFSAGHLVQAE